MRDFDERAWATAEVLLDNRADLVEAFKTWLAFPESQVRIEAVYGKEWTLEQAVNTMIPKRKGHRSQMAAASAKRHVIEDSEKAPRGRGGHRVKALGGPISDEDWDDDEPPEGEEEPEPSIDISKFKARVDERTAIYLGQYADIMPNDRAAINDLAAREVEMEILHDMLSEALASTDKNAAGKIGSISYALKKQGEEARALQKHLHIDRLSREKEADKLGAADEALEVIDAAGAFVEKWVVKVVHTNCAVPGVIGRSDILFFEVVRGAFPEVAFEIRFTCPRCHQLVKFNFTPSEEDIRTAREPEWVEAHEAEYNAQDAKLKQTELLKQLEENEKEEGE